MTMKTRFALFSGLIMVGAVACSQGNAERHAFTEQGIETVADAGDAADADGDALDTGAGDADPGSTCAHAMCATGAALVAACDPCATKLCAADSYCCSNAWDATCVGEVASICGKSCAPPPVAGDAGASTCVHAVCATGVALPSSCTACATKVCAQDLYCCTSAWDATCVGEVTSICGQSCK